MRRPRKSRVSLEMSPIRAGRGGEEVMRPQLQDDPILRESRRATLARRLISHGVRTEMIGQLTGLTRNRLAPRCAGA